MASQLFRVPELVGEILSYLDMRALMCISTTTRSIYREAIRQLVRNTSPSKPCHLRLLVGWLTRAPCISVSIKNLNIWWKADETPCRAHLMILASHLPRASGLSSLFGDSSTEALLGELSLLDVSNWRHLSQLTLRGVSPNDSRTLALVHCLPSKLRSFAISFREEESDGWRWLNGHQESLLRVSILGARLPEPAPGVFTRTVDLTVSLQHASECLISAFPNLTQLHGKHDGTRTRVYSAVKLQRWTHLRHLRGEWNISSVRSYSLPNLWLDGRLATNFMGVLRMAQQLYPGSLSLFGSIDQISEIDNDNFPRWPRLFEAVSVTAYWKKSDLNMNDFVNDAAVVVLTPIRRLPAKFISIWALWPKTPTARQICAWLDIDQPEYSPTILIYKICRSTVKVSVVIKQGKEATIHELDDEEKSLVTKMRWSDNELSRLRKELLAYAL